MCQKVPYDTKSEAVEDARFIRVSGGLKMRLRPYNCPWCDKWHLTSKRGGSKKQFKKFDK